MNQEHTFRQSYERGAVRVPGLPILPNGTERYVIQGGGSCSIAIQPGDSLTVIDEQGCQSAELVFFLPNGISTISPFSSQASVPAQALHKIVGSTESSAQRLRKALEAAGFELAHAQALQLPGDAQAGTAHDFQFSEAGLLIVVVAPLTMLPYEQHTLTPIIVYLRRAQIASVKSVMSAPDPLAEPVQDWHILPGQAQAYEVKAGQYVQVLDIQGRECSDFQAADLRLLGSGMKAFIDPTSTRSMTALGYPTPGLYSKYWSLNLQPMVEIVQDTCGRHDSFGLACTARYYEDQGYPGHVNCSDNINASLADYGVQPQAGWPAINFFFNTLLSQDNVITMDDPWSRPGDYVLLRALTDLVCVSTACPCDIDAANAWQPSDIQVRVYDKKELFKRSVAVRKSPEAEPIMTVESAFHDQFSRFTHHFVEYNGYWLPAKIHNLGAIAEYWNCRERVSIMDLSALRKFEITGPDAEALLQLCMTRDIKKLSIGQVVYTAMCYEHGGVIDDGTVFRLGDNNFRWVCGTEVSGDWLREQAEAHNFQAWVRHSTEQLSNIAVQGPRARELLSPLLWTAPDQTPITDLAWFRFSVARLYDHKGTAVIVSRTGYTGELGYEIFCHPKDGDAVFQALWAAGEPLGIQALGLEALDMLRIEAGLAFAGQEFCDQTDPFEAGIGFVVPLKSKADHFIGRDALLRRKTTPSRALVGLELDGGLVPSSGDCVRMGRAQVGEITSSIKSPILGKVIALCRVDIAYSAIGTQLEVGQLDGMQKRIPAHVVAFPHFDPSKQRVKGFY